MQSPTSTIGAHEASEALREASAAASRSAAASAYQRIGRRLIVWGVVWVVVNVAGVVRLPVDGTFAWPAAMLSGFLVSAALDVLAAPGVRGWRHVGESLVLNLVFAVFVMSTPLFIQQPTLIQVETLLTLVIGLVYVVIGLSVGWRIVAVGMGLMLVVIGGSVWAPDQFFIWMAAAGGGGLIVGGLWLRKA